MDARTASSGSSVWEGQLQSLVLSEYASTEMSLHALYMHQVSGQLSHRRFQPFSAPYLLCSLHGHTRPLNGIFSQECSPVSWSPLTSSSLQDFLMVRSKSLLSPLS